MFTREVTLKSYGKKRILAVVFGEQASAGFEPQKAVFVMENSGLSNRNRLNEHAMMSRIQRGAFDAESLKGDLDILRDTAEEFSDLNDIMAFANERAA